MNRARRYAAAERPATAAIALGLLVRIAYWQITGRKFEDGLITITHARSVVDGIGLTHHDFEPVTHGFTTAASVLIPLAGEIAGLVLPSVVDGFLALRLASLVALVASIVCANAIARRLGVGDWPRAFVLLFLAVDYNHVFYGMSGMETQVGVAVLLGAVLAVMDGRTTAAGVLLGLACLCRPDFGLFVVPALAYLVLRDRAAGLRAGGLAAAVVAPWLIFTTLYYGSPVPNSISAKALRYDTDYPSLLAPGDWWPFISEQVSARQGWWKTFTPFLENGFVLDAPIPTWLSFGIFLVVALAAVAGVVLSVRVAGWWPVPAFVLAYVVYRFAALPETYYEWYYPPVTALIVLLAGVGFTAVGSRAIAPVCVLLVAAWCWALPGLTVLDRRVQQEIEANVRVPMGNWLRVNVPPGDSVTSESAGYVGYFGRVKLLDYPGLTSGEALEIMRRLGPERNNILELIEAARPDFVILRPAELEAFRRMKPAVAGEYRDVRRWQYPPDQLDIMKWGGIAYVNIDHDFIVLRRRA